METEFGVEGSHEGKFVEGELSSSPFSSPKQITNPVVYKLVRLEGDGRLVPATDDEVMEVQGLLRDDTGEMHIVPDTSNGILCFSNEGSSTGVPQLERLEGLSRTENTDVDPEKSSVQLEESVPSLAQSLGESLMGHVGSLGECSNPSDKQIGGSSSSIFISGSKPDFSKLQGRICLDNLSIKELHETFRATFGRETTVKDKLWLKRRIAMGLTNSCDVSTTTFVIEDNKLVKNESSDNAGDGYVKDSVIGDIIGDHESLPTGHSSQLEDRQTVAEKKFRDHNSEDGNFISDEHAMEQRANKRVRKPTRRYIEELSELESKVSSTKLITSPKSLGLGQVSPQSHLRSGISASSDGRIVVTRVDSLGGFGIKVPCVYRVRRSRPRKNYATLLKINSGDMDAATSMVKKTLGAQTFVPEVMMARSASEQLQPQFLGEVDREKQLPAVTGSRLGHNAVPTHLDSSIYPDKNVVSVPTLKGGIRRKHHRAWTLSEVVKLVDGVSRYGAGRWSEIKRLAFASYSYRTSVDLKDKWRNLLKASFAQTPDKVTNTRKNAASMPIPAPILLRVRELAEMQVQDPPNHGSSKVLGTTGNSVNERQSGYL
ncbi:hypothetical protein K2173_024743 [Erythroxylum novogranatense]|uniref:Uncharacterized protein n=1 Tax=Erythroxylum novogranatense TaxID=1862640 RepID=A0AAV8SW12_9ROSI|nr:hypothetical protein K2173_024743 [Erythroxylum novogranatense]